MKETINDLKQKIHWFVLPLMITLLTFLVVNDYNAKEQLAVINHTHELTKEDQKLIMQNQEEMLVIARESRTFSMQNNNILSQKADRTDLQNIQSRLDKIEKKVDQIYVRQGWSYTSANSNSSYYLDTIVKNNWKYDQVQCQP